MNSFKVIENDILLIIKSLDSTEVQGCDNLSMIMIKICSELITLPLKIIFSGITRKGKISRNMEKANVVPVHQSKQKFFNKLLSN